MYFQLERLINDLENLDFMSKFGPMVWSFSTILGVKKVDFWTFSKLFWCSFRSVWALFLDLEGPFLGVFSAQKVDK